MHLNSSLPDAEAEEGEWWGGPNPPDYFIDWNESQAQELV